MPRDAEVPDGWEVVRLGDVASLRKEQMKPIAGDSTAYIALENIVSGGSLNGYGKAGDSVSNKTLFRKGDTLYGKLRPNLRKVVRVDIEGVCSTDILAVYACNCANSRYIAHLLRSDGLYRHAMRGIAGTKMPRTSWSHLQSFKLSVPPLLEQGAIAGVLDAIDEAIERTEAVIAATERLQDSLLHELLTRGVPGWHTEWKEVAGVGTVPACWEVVRLGEVVDHVGSGVTPRGGKSAYSASGVTFLRSQNVHFDGLRLDDVVYIPQATDESMRRSRVRSGDVVLNITGASIGRCTVVPPELGAANVNQHVCIIRVLEGYNGTYVSEWLSTSRSQREIDDMQVGQSRQGLNYQQVRQLTMACPPRPEQDRIVEAISGIKESSQRTATYLKRLEATKASMADALLAGRVRAHEVRRRSDSSLYHRSVG